MRQFILHSLVWSVCAAALHGTVTPVFSQTFAQGTVFHDRNRNGVREAGEEGLAGIRVSNQREIVITDQQGRWRLPATEDTIFFVIKPRGWRTPFNQQWLPQFYYIHKPAGSPPLKFAGVKPTGPLPASIDFALSPQPEPEEFQVIFLADPQTRNTREVEYLAHDTVAELIGTRARFGVTLGDIVFDDLSVFEPINATIALVGIPWHNVIGNHDLNFDAPNDALSDETFERIYGPSYYSFEYGPVHFLVLDNVLWEGAKPEGSGRYHAGLGAAQVEFVRNNLALVPKDQLLVLMMHIPLPDVRERAELYRLLENRPRTLSISGHTHTHEHRFLKQADGWNGPEPHHHVVNVTASGSWWAGTPDELGIPHAMMRDGAPKGYSIITFTETDAVIDFKAARRPAAYQMNIFAPNSVTRAEAAETYIYVNVFNGSERSRVEMQISGAEWLPLDKVLEPDPSYERMRKLEAEGTPARKWREGIPSPHLWKARLPAELSAGTHSISVRTVDMHGRTFRAERIITVH